MSQKKILRQSRDGYAFYENENSWHISKDIKLNFSQAVLNIDKKTLNSFRKTLAIYAEKYSSYHTINMYNRFHELVVNTQLKTIDTYTLLNWKTNLGKEREWHLGSLKGFLLSWHEYGYYGVDKAVASLLESFTLSGTARRPIQIRHLKFEDLKKETSQGTWNYFLNIPSAKKRGGLFRKTFKKIAITEDLYLVILNFLEYQYKKLLSLVDEAFISDYKMKLPMFIDWRSLKNNIKNRHFDLSLLKLDIFHYSSSSLELNVLRKFCIHQKAVSERTGEIIHVNARRFRHTRGTNLGRKGVGAAIIAELLDHSDTQNVKVYTENTADTVQYIDRVMGAEMGKLAQAFVGRIISNLNESERGFDPTSLITNNGVDTIGACGTNDFCITGYETCYLCPKFRPLVDGPHQQILNKLYKEKEERLRRTKSIDYASSKDRIILAVEYGVQACDEMKKNMEAH